MGDLSVRYSERTSPAEATMEAANLGSGTAAGAAQVYKARWHGTLVAVKVLQSEDAAEAGAFRQEVSLLEGLHHLHVVAYYDHMVAQDGTVSAPSRTGAHGCTLLAFMSLIPRLLWARTLCSP